MPMLYEQNPLLATLDSEDRRGLGVVYKVIRDTICDIGGAQPETLACPLVKATRSSYLDKFFVYRHIARWHLSELSERVVCALENFAAYIHAPREIQGRRHPSGAKRKPGKYITWNLGASETTLGFLLKEWGYQDAGSAGTWVCRQFPHKKTAAQRSKDGSWLYNGKALVEIREEPDIHQLDFCERVVQTAYILNHGEPYDHTPLVYRLYRDLMRSSLRTITSFDIAGLEEIIEFMTWTLFAPSKNRAAADYFGCKPESVVLAGVKGTGKTLIAEALATGDYHCLFVPVGAIQLVVDKYQARGKANVHEDKTTIFSAVEELKRKANVDIILHCDDIEAVLLDVNGTGNDAEHARVSTLLNKLAGIQRSGILLSGSTNDPYRIDDRFLRPGRIGYVLHVPLPDTAMRDAVLTIHTRRMPLASDVNIHALAEVTDGYTPAALAEICNRAGFFALHRLAASKSDDRQPFDALSALAETDFLDRKITEADFRRALTLVSRHVNTRGNQEEDRRIKRFCDHYQGIGFRPR